MLRGCQQRRPLPWCPSGGFEGGVVGRLLGWVELFEGRHFEREIIVRADPTSYALAPATLSAFTSAGRSILP